MSAASVAKLAGSDRRELSPQQEVEGEKAMNC
jgi:hypothetical protein